MSDFRYPLIPDDDKFALLRNGSLMVMNTQQMLSQDEYCVETVDFGDETGSDWLTTAIICFGSGEVPTSNTLFIIYAVGTYYNFSKLVRTLDVKSHVYFLCEILGNRGDHKTN